MVESSEINNRNNDIININSNNTNEISPRLSLLYPGFQISAHECPRIIIRELAHVFPGIVKVTPNTHQTVFAILICQKSQYDLAEFDEKVDTEKDILLERFITVAKQISDKIKASGYWCDFIDPCSGLPMLTPNTNKVYSEVDGMEILLRYRSFNAGMCKVLCHPQWGSHIYPASMFTLAPFSLIKDVLTPLLIMNNLGED